MSIESVLKESVEKADRIIRIGDLSDDMVMFCRMYVKRPVMTIAMQVLHQICYRFGKLAIEKRDTQMQELVAIIIKQRQPLWNNRVFLFGMFYGALCSLVVLAVVIFI